MQDKGAPVASREAALLACTLLIGRLGASFEPYAVRLLPVFLTCYSDLSSVIRDAAEAAAAALAATLTPAGVKLVLPPVLAAMGDRAWKKKESALQLLATLARRTPRQVGRGLPLAIPVVVACLQDTHPKVAAAAVATLADVASVITQPEIQRNMVTLIEALSKPETKTAACLEKLMETTFVNSMDAAALSVIVPVVTRGLRERSAELKKIAAMTAGNIFALVNDPRDMAPFLPSVLPEVTKAIEHSHPDVRSAAERAKVKLLKGSKVEKAAAGAKPPPPRASLAAHVRASLAALPEPVASYAAEVAEELLEDREVVGAEGLAAALSPVVGPFLDATAVDALATSTVALHDDNLAAAAEEDEHAGKDCAFWGWDLGKRS